MEATPVDPRQYVQPPQVDSLDENPLIRISGWALNPDQQLFDVRSDRSGPTRIRLAVLSDYDGITWRVGAVYRGAGRVLPAPATLPANAVAPVNQRIEIGDLSGRLLPAVPTPSRVDGVRVAYDPTTGTMIEPDGLRPGLAYTVSSLEEEPDLNLLTAADVPFGDGIARMLALGPGAPDRIRELSDRLAADAGGGAYQRALGIEDYLATHYKMVADAPSGHAYPNLAFFLFGPANGGGQQGTSEQFAAAYAVLARMMGLPTRIVVGFRSETGTGPVRGADAQAWPEVYFTDVGWVAFDPLPKPDTVPEPPEREPPKPDPPTPPPSEAPLPTLEPTASPTAGPIVAVAPGGSGLLPVYAGGGGGLLLLVVVALLALLLRRRGLTERRLAGGTPGQRVAGAWLEVRDALRLAGDPAAAHLSATELAGHAEAAVRHQTATAGDDPRAPELAALVDLVNRDAFAPARTGEPEATAAAGAARTYTARLRATRSRWRRLIWPFHPGPLRWQRDD